MNRTASFALLALTLCSAACAASSDASAAAAPIEHPLTSQQVASVDAARNIAATPQRKAPAQSAATLADGETENYALMAAGLLAAVAVARRRRSED
jgi:MYXO-CTERM domain-containing protein